MQLQEKGEYKFHSIVDHAVRNSYICKLLEISIDKNGKCNLFLFG